MDAKLPAAGEVIQDRITPFLYSLSLLPHAEVLSDILRYLETEEPDAKDLTIAAVGVLMQLSSIKWVVIAKILDTLRTRDEKYFDSDSVVLLNGKVLLVPFGSTKEGFKSMDIITLRECEVPEELIASNGWHLSGIWKLAQRAINE